MKMCSQCEETKELSEFYNAGGSRYMSLCKFCDNARRSVYAKTHPEQHRAKGLAWDRANPERRKELVIKSKYGLSPKEYKSLPKECAICGTTENLHLDHDHVTNKFRGVLCRDHNLGLGLFHDDPEMLLRAVDYLLGFLKPHIIEMVKKMVGK